MRRGQDKRGTPWKVLLRKPQSKHNNTITKPEKINVAEELEDTSTFLEGPRSGHEDHQTHVRGKEGMFVIEWMKDTDKASFTSTFNTLHPLS